jgi:hypothetical protein
MSTRRTATPSIASGALSLSLSLAGSLASCTWTTTGLGSGASGDVIEAPAPAPTAPEDAVQTTPESAETRAERALGTLNEYCARHGDACIASLRSEAPAVQVPEQEWRFVSSQVQELRSLGFIVRWDPGSRRAEIAPGNTLSHRGDPASDP